MGEEQANVGQKMPSKLALVLSRISRGARRTFTNVKTKLKFSRGLASVEELGKEGLENLESVAREVMPTSSEDPLISQKMKHRVMAALSYLCLFALIPLIFGRRYDFTRFHVKQGLILLSFWVIGSFFFWLPYAGWLVLILWLAGMVYGLVNVFTSKERRLPLIGRLA